MDGWIYYSYDYTSSLFYPTNTVCHSYQAAYHINLAHVAESAHAQRNIGWEWHDNCHIK